MSSVNEFQAFGRSIRNQTQHADRHGKVPASKGMYNHILQHMFRRNVGWAKEQYCQNCKLARYSDECEVEVQRATARVVWTSAARAREVFKRPSKC